MSAFAVLYALCCRCVGTFSNYLGYLRNACYALNMDAPPENHPALRRAKAAIIKRMVFTPRPKMFIQKNLVAKMMRAITTHQEDPRFAMLWLCSSAFLLRVTSDALPLARGGPNIALSADFPAIMHLNDQVRPASRFLSYSAFLRYQDELCIRLKRRKNLQSGSLIKRSCTCDEYPLICPVHVLWESYMADLSPGEKPWAHISPGTARKRLRNLLRVLEASPFVFTCCTCSLSVHEVPNSSRYGTHDLRRGHAKARPCCA